MSAGEDGLPSGWDEAPLGNVVEILDSRRIPLNAGERALRPGPFPYYGANGQAGVIDDFLFDGDYVLVAEDGGYFDDRSRGVAYRATGKFWVNNHAHIVGPRGGMASPFLVYAFNSLDWMPYVSGTTRLKLTQGKMTEVPLPIPPLNEQKRIVAKIEALQARSDAAKEALDAIGPLLEKFRQSVLAAAFRGDLTKKWREQHPDTEPASKLLERIRAERRRRWEEANPRKKYVEPEPVDAEGLPELPEGWCWATAAELCITITDGDHQPPPQTESGVAFLVIGNVSGGVVDTTGCRFVDQSYYDGLDDARRPQKGDLLYTVTGSFGIVAPVLTNEPFCVQRHIAILRPNPEIDTGLLGLSLASPGTRKQAVSVATGTAQMTVPLRGLRAFVLPVPPADEAKVLRRTVETALSAVSATGARGVSLAGLLRDMNQSILAKAFRGELVPQDPNDEPASVLLERIRRERDGGGNGSKRTRSPRGNGAER